MKPSTYSPGIMALERIVEDHTLLQPHPFTLPMSQGLGAVLDSDLRESLERGMQMREKASKKDGRDDNDAYIFNLFGHLVVHHIRTNPDQIGEEQLVEYRSDPDNPENPLNRPEFWQDAMSSFVRHEEKSFWLNLICKDTQSCVEERYLGIMLGIASVVLAKDTSGIFRDIDTENINILDIGGSAGFVSARLLEPRNIKVANRKLEFPVPIDYSIKSSTIVDIGEGETRIPDNTSWIRNCSVPLGTLTTKAIGEYGKKVDRTKKLVEDGKMNFVRMTLGYKMPELEEKFTPGAYNIFVASTMLHQLDAQKRAELMQTIKNLGGETNQWALIINDFAKLPHLRRDHLKFEQNRWHNGKNALPYRTFAIPGWTNKPRIYEVAAWKTSRCAPKDCVLDSRSLMRNAGFDKIFI